MEAAQLSARVTERYPDVVCAVDPFGVVTADVPTGDWVGVATFARDELGCTFFDWLSAVDQGDGEPARSGIGGVDECDVPVVVGHGEHPPVG